MQHQQLKYGTGNPLKNLQIGIASELYYFVNCKWWHDSVVARVLENIKITYTEKYWSSALF